jgi:pimeloyl-ACP methyl ester carboxylesterase
LAYSAKRLSVHLKVWCDGVFKEIQIVAATKSLGWKRRTVRILTIALTMYLALFALLLIFEDRLLFRPDREDDGWVPPPKSLTQLQDVWLDADGTQIHAWWSPPQGWDKSKGASLYCHGNAGNVSYCGQILASWNHERGEAILALDYPGFGKSEGKPSESGCYAAARAAYAWLTNQQAIDPDRIILVGQSLGAAVATNLAADHPHRALVLISPFTSMPDMAAKQFPIFPGRWFIHNRFDNLERIGHCRRPIFIVHGIADPLVPSDDAQRIHAAANTPKRILSLEGVGHDVALNGGFYLALNEFLQTSEPSPDQP